MEQVQPVQQGLPQKDTLAWSDIRAWLKETFIFSIPAIVAILTSLAGGMDWRIALGAGYSALGTSLMNLYGKYKAGV